ncbi:unnamed protein product, partial [Amoebophrya sp. A25]
LFGGDAAAGGKSSTKRNCSPLKPLEYQSERKVDEETGEEVYVDKLWIDWSTLRRQLFEAEKEAR